MKYKYKLKNRARFTAFIFVLVVTVILSFSVRKSYGYKEQEFLIIKVEKGDTLWDIAEKYGKNGDIRKYIYSIKKLNNLETGFIYEGDLLKIPVY